LIGLFIVNHDVGLIQVRGEVAALGTALLWAIAAIIYTRLGKQVPPLPLNVLKGLVAIALLILTITVHNESLPLHAERAIGLLSLSGVAGIGVGDTAYFAALNCLGASRTLLLEMLAPPLTALLALLGLGESLTLQNGLGMGLTVAGIAWVTGERTTAAIEYPKHWLNGYLYVGLSVVGQSSGAVLSRTALTQSPVNPLWSALIRLSAGTLSALILLGLQKQQGQALQFLRSRDTLIAVALTAFFSTFLGIWLQQISLKYAPAGIAQALGATSPLFVLPLAILSGETITLRTLLGVSIAIVGIGLLFS
jgi:drug/metabolite transporter (DMT)-like permease